MAGYFVSVVREALQSILDPLAVLFQKLLTSEERLPVTGDDVVVRLPFSEEANNAVLRQRPLNTVPSNGAFNVVAHG